MATTYQEHTGNGSLTTFSYPFPVLKTEDIKVALDGVTQTTGYTATTSPAQVVFTTAPEDGVVVRVYRDTDVDSAKGVFAAGSSIRAADLNNNQDQVLYALQEEQNQKGIFESITLDDGGQIKLGNSDDFTLTWYSAGFADITAPIINIEGDVRFKPNVGIRFIIEDTEIRTLVDFKPWGSNIDLGKSDSQWKDLYVDGTGYIDTINADNITVSGNVDGRDISVDGTKLDTVETNAKDDQTAAEIKTLLQSDKLSISEINTTSLDSHTDGRYYTETEADARFYNLASAEEIQSGETWVAADNKVATTAAIDARIVDLVSVPLANNVTSNGSGVITISNGTVGNSTVTINGAGDTKTYAQGFGIIVETTTTLNTYTFHRYVPKATEVTTVAGNITNINTVAGNNSNITTVAGISANVTTVAGISSDVTSVAGDATDIGTVAGAIGNVNNVGGNISNVNSVAGNATNINAAVSNASNINTCATNISSITDASTQATNAANSATNAASSATTATTQATTATTQATTATTQATTATTKATNAAASASNAATSETNAATSEANSNTFRALAEEYKNLAYDYKNAASGFFTQEVSSTYNLADNVASHTAWGDVTAETGFHNEHLGSDTALTMSTGSSTYDYGSIT